MYFLIYAHIHFSCIRQGGVCLIISLTLFVLLLFLFFFCWDQKMADLQSLMLRNKQLLKSGNSHHKGFSFPFILAQVYKSSGWLFAHLMMV